MRGVGFTEGVPRWRKGIGLGWVTAEYAMLPRLDQHPLRPRVGQRPDRRPHPRDLPADRPLACAPVIDYQALGENTIVLDCDVLQADGGTRTAAITGAYVALVDAVEPPAAKGVVCARRAAHRLGRRGQRRDHRRRAAARPRTTTTTSRAETDMNVVMTGDGRFVEVQGTAEGAPFDRAELDALLELAATAAPS